VSGATARPCGASAVTNIAHGSSHIRDTTYLPASAISSAHTASISRVSTAISRATRFSSRIPGIPSAACVTRVSANIGSSARFSVPTTGALPTSSAFTRSDARNPAAAGVTPDGASLVFPACPFARCSTYRASAGTNTDVARCPDQAAQRGGVQRLRRRIQLALDREQIATLSEHAIIRVQHAKVHTQVIGQR